MKINKENWELLFFFFFLRLTKGVNTTFVPAAADNDDEDN